MKKIREARNTVAKVFIVIGIALLLFAILWWVVAVNRLVRYPAGVTLATGADCKVERLTDKNGLLTFEPPQQADVSLSGEISSVDEEYTSSTAVVDQAVSCDGEELPGDIILSEENTYVMSRSDCINKESELSRSSGTVVDRSGSWSVNFPLGTGKQSYNVFNNDVASSFSVQYQGETEVQGVKAYIFKGSFRHRPMVDYRVAARGLPRTTTYADIKQELNRSGIPIDEMIEMASGSLTPAEYETISSFPENTEVRLEYTVKYSWEAAVEPVTGTIVDVMDESTRIFVNTDIQAFLPLFEILASYAEDPLVVRYLSQIEQQKILEPKEKYRITSNWTDDTVEESVEHARSRIGPIKFIKDYVTYLFLIIGAVFLVAGLVIRRERRHHRHEDEAGAGAEERAGDA